MSEHPELALSNLSLEELLYEMRIELFVEEMKERFPEIYAEFEKKFFGAPSATLNSLQADVLLEELFGQLPPNNLPAATITYFDEERTCQGHAIYAPSAAQARIADSQSDLVQMDNGEPAVDTKASDDLIAATPLLGGYPRLPSGQPKMLPPQQPPPYVGPIYQFTTGNTSLPAAQEMGYGAPKPEPFPGGQSLAYSGEPQQHVYMSPNPFEYGPQLTRPVTPLSGRGEELSSNSRGGVDQMPFSAPLHSENIWLGYQVYWPWQWDTSPAAILTPNAMVILEGAWSGVLYGGLSGETHIWLEKGSAAIVTPAGSTEITGPADGEHLLLITIAADGSIAPDELVTPADLAERYGILNNALPGWLSISIEVAGPFSIITDKAVNELAWQLWLDTDGDPATGSQQDGSAGAEIFYNGQGDLTTCTTYTPMGEAQDCESNPFSLLYDPNGAVVIKVPWQQIAALVEAAGSAADPSVFTWRVGHVNIALPGQPADYIP